MTDIPRPDERREPSFAGRGTPAGRPPAVPWWKARRAEMRGVLYPPDPSAAAAPAAPTPATGPGTLEPSHPIDRAQAELARAPLAIAGLLLLVVVVVAHFTTVPIFSRVAVGAIGILDRKSTRLNSSH